MKYTVEAGRNIYRDGKPWIYLGGRNGVNGGLLYNPCEVDRLAYLIADLLNGGWEYDESSPNHEDWRWIKK